VSKNTCGPCVSESREGIDRDLAEGLSVRKAASKYSFSSASMGRHAKHRVARAGHVSSVSENERGSETAPETSTHPASEQSGQGDESHESLPESAKKKAVGRRGADGLTPSQRRAIAVLVGGGTFTAAASAAGRSMRTLFNWRSKDEAFREYLASMQRAQEEVFERRLVIAGSNAVGALSGVMEDPKQAGVEAKTKAAVGLLNASTRLSTRTQRLDVTMQAAVPMIIFPKGTLNPALNTKQLPAPPDPYGLAAPVEEVVDAELVKEGLKQRETDPAHQKGWKHGREASK
jgi:hypothetical protein